MKPDLRGWALPVGLLVLTEVLMPGPDEPSETVARPSAVLQALWVSMADGSLWTASWQTLWAATGGLALGGGLGLALGIWLGLSRRAAVASSLSVELLRPVPSVALLPLSMLVFGFGHRMEMAVVAFTCFWPMLLLTQTAIRHVEPRLLEVAYMLGLSPVARVFSIVLPAALPRVFVAFRLCVGIALVVAVTAEVTANPQGLGYALMSAQQSLHPEQMFAMLLWIGVLGWALTWALQRLQMRWFRHSVSAEEGVPS